MKYGRLPPLDRELSRLVMGTNRFDLSQQTEAFALLDHWRELGGTTLDTARVYSAGESEAVIGRWLEDRGCREQTMLITKGVHPKDGDATSRLTAAAIAQDLGGSLAALRTNYVDVYLLHRDYAGASVGPILEALNDQLAAGRIRCFGASNWTVERLEEAAEYAEAKGIAGFACSSPHLSLASQNLPPWSGTLSAADDVSLNWYRRTQMPLLAWSAQANGFFSCGVTKQCAAQSEVARIYFNAENWQRHARVAQLSKSIGLEPTSVALGWVLAQPFPTFAVIGSSSLTQMESSLACVGLELSSAEVDWLWSGSGQPVGQAGLRG